MMKGRHRLALALCFARPSLSLEWAVCLHASDVRHDRALTVRALQQIARLGATLVRTDFDWADFQPEGAHAWSNATVRYFEEYVADAGALGVQLVMILSHPPQWAWDLYASADVDGFLAAYEAYAAKMGALYGARVKYVQYWNEPNNLNDQIAAADRWRLFLAADRGVRQAVAAPRGMVNYDADSIYRLGWLPQLREAFARIGAAEPQHTIRTIALDVYPSTWSLPSSLGGWRPLAALHRALADPSHPCYGFDAALTETGYSQFFSPASWFRRSQQWQAEWFSRELPQLLRIIQQFHLQQAKSRYLFVGLYELYDKESSKTIDPEAYFGLYLSDMRTEKLAVSAIRSVINSSTAMEFA
ncbi:hypothetical protein AB1Y20_008880 [Prymnesium parvum]|uniref:Beta-galactosidase n=1 Tax=Prymnesium parvum TaxID=97485 RepID=A0AB34IUI9_PRYPA